MTILPTSCEPMRIKVKGFQLFKDRHGKMRCYHRATGEAIDLEKFPIDSVEFLGECSRICALYKPKDIKPGTLGMLIKKYKESPKWAELKPKTQTFYEEAFIYLSPIHSTAIIRFNRPLVVKIRDKAYEKKTWWFANQIKTSISVLFQWGSERGYIEENYASGIKRIGRPKDLPRANRPWTDKERFVVLEEMKPHFKPVIGAILYTGADTCDVIRFPNKTDSVEFSRQKTGVEVKQKLKSAFKSILAHAPKHTATTLLANSYGNPWTADGVNSVWSKERRKLEAQGKIGKGLTLKGLRHTHATILREMGEDDRTIADALGQKSQSMGRHYSRDADISKKMDGVTKKFNRAEAQKIAKFVKPSNKSVKP